MPKKTIKEYYDDKRQDWYYSDIDLSSVKAQHVENLRKCQEAKNAREVKDRPLYVAVLHGSGRHTELSCAHEKSNSQLYLERAVELAKQEWEGRPIETETHVLREYVLEPCNACYSTASALCNFTCTCFPGDDISSKIYPSILRADVMLWSSPVNQASISSRTKLVLDRLISLDGGYYIVPFPTKDDTFRQQAIELSTKEKVDYDPRMFGKVAAYFITSKDWNNPLPESAPYPRDFRKVGYEETVIGQLAVQGTEYGWHHADPFYSVMAATHDQEMSYDKAEFNGLTTDHEDAKEVVLAALKLGEQYIDNGPSLVNLGRIGRT
jgi:multimeric flavodoxin WrbA